MDDALQALFREVADLSPSERARYFEAQLVPAHLRAEVESLLRFDTRRPLPHADSVTSLAADVMRLESETAAGERCGPYTLIRPLGQGGMGTVFLAQRMDGEVEQRVAVKVVSNQTSSTFHGLQGTKFDLGLPLLNGIVSQTAVECGFSVAAREWSARGPPAILL